MTAYLENKVDGIPTRVVAQAQVLQPELSIENGLPCGRKGCVVLKTYTRAREAGTKVCLIKARFLLGIVRSPFGAHRRREVMPTEPLMLYLYSCKVRGTLTEILRRPGRRPEQQTLSSQCVHSSFGTSVEERKGNGNCQTHWARTIQRNLGVDVVQQRWGRAN